MSAKRAGVKQHRKRILEGLAELFEHHLYENEAAYIYEDRAVPYTDKDELAEIRKAGDLILRQLRGLVDR